MAAPRRRGEAVCPRRNSGCVGGSPSRSHTNTARGLARVAGIWYSAVCGSGCTAGDRSRHQDAQPEHSDRYGALCSAAWQPLHKLGRLRGRLGSSWAAVRSLKLAVGATLEDQVVRSSQQTIQRPLRQHRIGKQRIPILGWAITGDDDRASTGAITDQLVQVIRLLGRVLAHGEVVEDQQRRQQVVAQPTVPGAVGMPAAQIAQQPARS